MWNKIKKILLIMIVVSLVLPTSALDLISSVYAQVSQSSNVEMQNFDALNDLLETSTSQQENTDEIEGVETEGEASPKEETPSDDVQTPTEEEQAPSDIEVPNEGEEAPSDVETPTEEEDIPSDDVQTPTEDEQAPSDEIETPVEEEDSLDEEEISTEEEVIEDDEVVEGEEIVPAPLNFTIDPNMKFLPNIRDLYGIRLLADIPETTNTSFLYGDYMAHKVADLNTSDSQNPFLNGTTSNNNGRVWVDKSVTMYSNYNYDTFQTINESEFNVILSAIGQEFEVSESEKVSADVVFVLDVSGSMKNQKVSSGNTQITRAQAAVNAINTAITELMEKDSNTRVGVVTFSGPSTTQEGVEASNYAKILLPLDSYKANQSDVSSGYAYLKYSEKGHEEEDKEVCIKWSPGKCTQYGTKWVVDSAQVSHADNLNVKDADISTANFIGGTYTQAGIQKGANLLVKASNKGNRLPALILVTDGQPTYGTTDYSNVGKSEFGNGSEKDDDTSGKMGYYTILTAQYQKSQIASAYTKTPMVFTLGLGITDQYGKTVLNPTPQNINALSTRSANESTLRSLLKASNTAFNGTSYANYSQSGAFSASDLNSLLANIVDTITTTAYKPFAAKGQETAIMFTDVIGEGMEIKGKKIYVSYAGKNYLFQKQIDGTFISETEINVTDDRHNSVVLNNVAIRVTDEKGIQTLTWEIPAELVPVYSTYDDYESTSPIRLVYTVGLKDSVSLDQVYYTNAYIDDNGTITPLTKAEFTLASGNPYTSRLNTTLSKTGHYTETANHSTQMNVNGSHVIATLGNNGKLSFEDTKTTITTKKLWDDFENKHQTRPATVKVQLMQNSKQYGNAIELKASDNWTYTWTELPAYDANNNAYIYTVEEVDVPTNYDVTYSEDRLTITNTLKNVTEKMVTKVWNDFNNSVRLRPTTISVQLLQNSEPYKTVELSEINNWKATWSNLPKYDNKGNEYIYSVKEETVPDGYEVTYSDDTFTITNTLINVTEKTVTKIWDDFNNQNTTRPESIQVQLKQDGENYGNPVTLASDENGNWLYKWTNLPKYDLSGKEYEYTVEEIEVPGYTADYSEDTFTITNTLVNKTNKTVTKVWDDFDNEFKVRPTSIQVQLKQDEVNYESPVTISSDETGNWSYTWTNLPKYKETGEPYVYTVEEVEIPNRYEVSYNQETLTITNKLKQHGNIQIIKSEKNGALSGVQFLLEKSVNGMWETVTNQLTDSDGMISISELELGTYRLTEMSTVEGYKLLESAIEFSIPYEASNTSKPSGVTIEVSTDQFEMPVITVHVANYKNGIFENLPATGGKGITMFMIGGSALSGLAISLYIRAERKNKRSAKL
ncbi:Cna B-type domain-containing protein [Turicibacter sanguinis]|uniref:Cna B-type domain-containing protein n=1 Tax=Turicibacter sanguinis TaxID=154288 RepID=UPI0018975544|nr:Cna B-type domain-containing protein [Turicibacter sanguinis]